MSRRHETLITILTLIVGVIATFTALLSPSRNYGTMGGEFLIIPALLCLEHIALDIIPEIVEILRK